MNLNTSQEWLKWAAETEDGCEIGVGGALVDAGLYRGMSIEITTLTRTVNVRNVTAADISFFDAAHQLPMLCRFNGSVTTFYSVAHHCVLVASILRSLFDPMANRNDLARWGLLHDVHETIFGDIAAPIRDAFGITRYEAQAQRAVAEKFGLPWPPPVELHDVDLLARAVEWRELRSTVPMPADLANRLPQESTADFLTRVDRNCPWTIPPTFFETDRFEARRLFELVAEYLDVRE